MIELIVGEKGKGKTKMLMAKANNDIKVTGGNIVYLDKNNKHMYELSNRVRLINVPEFNIRSVDMFIGFLYGIASQDADLDKVFLDNFISISYSRNVEDVERIIKELVDVSEKFEMDFIIGLSMKTDDLTDYLKDMVTIAL